jgi:hypothetical protein
MCDLGRCLCLRGRASVQIAVVLTDDSAGLPWAFTAALVQVLVQLAPSLASLSAEAGASPRGSLRGLP